jgi:hypothetical protein
METWVIEHVRPPGVGPWNNEPDKARWVDEATGFDCIVLRHPRHGNLNGYVGVPVGHPLYGQDYDAAYERVDIQVHGGLTFAGAASEPDVDEEFRRTPHPDRPQDVWWFGFDCAHAWDLSPTMSHPGPGPGTPPRQLRSVLSLVLREVGWTGRTDRGGMRARLAEIDAELAYRETPGFEDVYRPFGYVKAEVESLARQLAAAS